MPMEVDGRRGCIPDATSVYEVAFDGSIAPPTQVPHRRWYVSRVRLVEWLSADRAIAVQTSTLTSQRLRTQYVFNHSNLAVALNPRLLVQHAAFALFDKDGNGDISKKEMREAVRRIYRERKALTASLKVRAQL